MRTVLRKSKLIVIALLSMSFLSGCNLASIKSSVFNNSLIQIYRAYCFIKPWLVVIGILSFLIGLLAYILAKRTPTIRKVGLFVGMIAIPIVCIFTYYGIPAFLSNYYEYLKIYLT